MHETIRGLYEGMLDRTAWRRSLRSLCTKSDSAQASIIVVEHVNGHTRVEEVAHSGITDSEPISPPRDPRVGLAGPLSVGQWQIGLRRASGVAQLFGGVSAPPLMTCLVDRSPRRETYLCLQRRPEQTPYDADDAQSLDWAVPHLRQAMALCQRAQAEALALRAAIDVISRLQYAVLVARGNGALIVANAAGEAWARRLLPQDGNAGTSGSGAHGTAGWRLSRPLPEVLRLVCETAAPPQAIHAAGHEGRTAQIVIVPMRPGGEVNAALVAIHENRGAPMTMNTILRDLFALTPAESRLASLMMTGIGLPEACTQLGVKRETSRTQLKSIFTKTGTGTQAQLAHLLTRIGSVLAGPA
ncbi:helix-turn-helix transcriptional regulator [Cupriavidus plantarum]|uniref:DNA-binding CsgD family transcriptional regulator n=1 Tax=Cupriavidus plantarum TaxID=942865 RepID=A0A316F3M0_9BURK|nr:helix-turn-helix transcriptional regulator [Cupriavidus plantarum]PWK38408.1 DNA-binding CsgD family transcriptional regulator [Cupriavidus plantarum]REE92061.1 DNA-binding CsgD family transcriptional regulator [Cupriavidus plantarum]